jgi:hypothetical protein
MSTDVERRRALMNIRGQILAAAQHVGAEVFELQPEEAEFVRCQASSRYAKGRRNWLWEQYEDSVAIHHEPAWTWMTDFLREKEVLVFFNQEDCESVFDFYHGEQVVPVLDETNRFEIYITNRTADFLLSFNHHDVLSALGMAREWLRNQIARE